MTRRFFAVIAAALLTFTAGFQTNTVLSAHTETAPARKLVIPQLPLVEGKSQNVGTDGYLFERATAWNTGFQVKVVTYPSLAALRADRVKFDGSAYDSKLIAFTVPPSWMNHNTCEMHIVDPRVLYWPEYIGHEFVHCMTDNFHSDQDVLGKADPTK